MGHTAGRSNPTQLKYKLLTIIAYSTGGNVAQREGGDEQSRKCQGCSISVHFSLVFVHCIHMNMPTIVSPSSAPHELAAREVEQNIQDTSDREQKSLTTGSISPKQKILHNIL